MEYQNFKLEIDEQGIAVFTANRPEKMNALNDLSWAEMNQFFTWADKADEVKVIIVTGAGEKAFIAGADLNSLKTKKSTDCLGGAGQKALDLIQKCSKPVIAAVNGYAFGGGCETAIGTFTGSRRNPETCKTDRTGKSPGCDPFRTQDRWTGSSTDRTCH